MNARLLWRVLVLLIVSMCLVCAASAQERQHRTRTSVERNKTLVQRWIDQGFNSKDVTVVDDVFADQFSINGQLMSRDALKQTIRRRLMAFPDLRVTVDAIIGEGNQVGIWYTAKGTQKAEFDGVAATGRMATWTGTDWFRIDSGKITQCRFLDDSLGLLQQLGVTLVMPPARP